MTAGWEGYECLCAFECWVFARCCVAAVQAGLSYTRLKSKQNDIQNEAERIRL